MGKLYINTFGISMLVDTNLSLQNTILVGLEVKKPSGNIVTWDASKYGTKQVAYSIETNDLDEVGIYQIQAFAKFKDKTLFGETFTLRVYDDFE